MTPNNNSSTEIFCTVLQCKINLFLKSVVSAKFEEMKRNLVNFNATFARLKIFCETLPLIDEDGWGSRALSKMSKLPQRFKHDNFSIVIIATTIRLKRDLKREILEKFNSILIFDQLVHRFGRFCTAICGVLVLIS